MVVYDKIRLRKQRGLLRVFTRSTVSMRSINLGQILHLVYPAQNVSFQVVVTDALTCKVVNQSPEVHLNLVDGNFVFPSHTVLGRKPTIVTWAGLCCLTSTTSPFGVFAMTNIQELAYWLLPTRKEVLVLVCEVLP